MTKIVNYIVGADVHNLDISAPFIREFQQNFESEFFFNSGLNWVKESVISRHKRFAKKENVTYWCDKQGRIYGNRLSSLIIEDKFASQFQESLQRLGKFCDLIVVDEFQDFTSADAKFLKRLMTEFEKEVIFVGDLFQACVATTSPRQSPYKDVRILDEEAFVRKRLNLPKTKVKVDLDSFVKSHRISTKVANFVSTNLGIKISSDGQHTGQVQYLDVENIDSMLEQTSKILVYKSVEKIPLKFRDKALTWKLSKGLTFDDTTVILTKSALDILTSDKKLKEASNAQINSLYVALTRSLSNLFLVTPNVWKDYKQKIEIKSGK